MLLPTSAKKLSEYDKHITYYSTHKENNAQN